MSKKIILRIVIVFGVILTLLHTRACMIKKKPETVPPRPVHTSVAFKKDVPIYVNSFGTVTALYNVNVKSRITGQVQEIYFTEGDEVKKNDLLVLIDPRIFKADLNKAEAALAEGQADYKMKCDIRERNRKVFEKNLIADQAFEQYQTDAAAAEAQVQLDEADVELARINLDYCSIKAPIDGVAGKRQIDPGNIVSANTGASLVNIKYIDTVYIDFTLPEIELPKVRKAMLDGHPRVEIKVQGDDNKYSGELKFIDNSVDQSTGTFSLRATIDNKHRNLWPGQFGNVRLILFTEKDAVLVPYKAVQIGQRGEYVFVVDENSKAELRSVETGLRQADNIVIKSGVEEKEKVVTAGQMGLSPGTPVVELPEEDTQKNVGAKTAKKR
jgi:multidrug efflux system membrane fusion protein